MADYKPIDFTRIITTEPGRRYGRHCIRDLEVTVGDVLEYLAMGKSEEELLVELPGLTRDDIKACLAFAAARERRGVTAPPDMPAVNDYSHIITIERPNDSAGPASVDCESPSTTSWNEPWTRVSPSSGLS